ncbi:hypothetical protein RRG08_003592 [Elysia crispata]|uniref:Ig-like domain-containing protein n=1 Tax=Elysia crispata TaxID=231223 RepID=A0AAE0Z1V3_9GAST|nr:hypothetical protein RRG08_003592 [Elysia crispata]
MDNEENQLSRPTGFSQPSHSCLSEAVQGYYLEESTTCTCSLSYDARDTAKWYKGGQQTGSSGTLVVSRDKSNPEQIYTCEAMSDLGRKDLEPNHLTSGDHGSSGPYSYIPGRQVGNLRDTFTVNVDMSSLMGNPQKKSHQNGLSECRTEISNGIVIQVIDNFTELFPITNGATQLA